MCKGKCNMEILNIENLSFKYNGADKEAVKNLSFSLNEGELLLLCGETGCGKTTLMKLIKKELSPAGTVTGNIFINGKSIWDFKGVWDGVGLVMQNPAAQIVTDTVYREMAFGLENIGVDPLEIRLRVAEMAQYFGLEEILSQRTDELSGGKQQMLNLASVMTLRPQLLLLDEPTSQLDPLMAREFFSVIKRLSEETGTTVIIAEHRLEEIFPKADKVLVLKNGEKHSFGTPADVATGLRDGYMQKALPSAARIFINLVEGGRPPLTVREGRKFLENFGAEINEIKEDKIRPRHTAVSLEGVYFRYEKNAPDVLCDFSLSVYEGEFLSVIGGNAAGKTTLLSIISGQKKPYMGKIKLFSKKYAEYARLYRGNIAYLPQDVTTVFLADTVLEDCLNLLEGEDIVLKEKKIRKKAALLGIEHKLSSHPYDLSGGERQKAALLKILLLNPKVLLLDEPTKGIDPVTKEEFGNKLKSFCEKGMSVIAVTHDIEFAAEFSDRCAMISQGRVIALGSPREIFGGNHFYTTAASRISKGKYKGAVLVDDIVKLCSENKRIKK